MRGRIVSGCGLGRRHAVGPEGTRAFLSERYEFKPEICLIADLVFHRHRLFWIFFFRTPNAFITPERARAQKPPVSGLNGSNEEQSITLNSHARKPARVTRIGIIIETHQHNRAAARGRARALLDDRR